MIPKFKILILTLPTMLFLSGLTTDAHSEDSFSWNNATIYFVYVDRFYNGDSSNDLNYNRMSDHGSDLANIATFHGGDIIGLTQKLEEGYFSNLGVTAIWITGVYEQIHGWVGGGSENDFPHYGYHGYYPMDLTQMDKNYGTIEEFRNFVNLAHSQNIRVVMDAGLNHPGYQTLLDAVQYEFGGVQLNENEAAQHKTGLIENKKPPHDKRYAYLDEFDPPEQKSWEQWWSSTWVRSTSETNKDKLTESIFGLPDFRTESKSPVKLPPFLKRKWEKEDTTYSAWVNPSAMKYRKDLNIAPADYVISWITAWVEEFGIDGFRCDVIENVDTFRWKQLNEACNKALYSWRLKNKENPAANWDEAFWMTGDIEDAGIEVYSEYQQAGFASIVNFTFSKSGNLNTIGSVWQTYADALNEDSDWTTLSFLNSTYLRDAAMDNMTNCGTTLLLAPGAIQILYGDEVARPQMTTTATDPSHGFRSDFKWGKNPEILAHWQKIGMFRKKHPAVGSGKQITKNKSTFVRIYEKDVIVIHLSDEMKSDINLEGVFEDGTQVRNAYTGETCEVKKGRVEFDVINNVVLVEAIQGNTSLFLNSAAVGAVPEMKASIFEGVNVNAMNTDGQTALYLVSKLSRADLAQWLLCIGADVNIAGTDKITPLHWATEFNNTKLASILLQKGANVNAKDSLGETPLHWAAWTGNTEVAKLLLKYGSNALAENNSGTTPLMLAKRQQHKPVIELFEK